jgi:hypothetical protein
MSKFKYLIGAVSAEDATYNAHARGAPSDAYLEQQDKPVMTRKQRRRQEAMERKKGKSNENR